MIRPDSFRPAEITGNSAAAGSTVSPLNCWDIRRSPDSATFTEHVPAAATALASPVHKNA